MSEWPQVGSSRILTGARDAANSRGATFTTATPHTKTDWQLVYTTLPYNVFGFTLGAYSMSSNSDCLVDIATGDATTKTIRLANLAVGSRSSTNFLSYLSYHPIFLPKGTNVYIRAQTTLAPTTVVHAMNFHGGELPWAPSYGRCTTLGADTTDSGGVVVDSGSVTANQKGVWSVISASLPHEAAELAIAIGMRGDTSRLFDCWWLMDIGYGGIGSEQIAYGDIQLGCNSPLDIILPQFIGPFRIGLPAGARLVARAQCGITGDDRLFDVIGYAYR